jgi:DNA-directed RNA polymerase specialized sigma24 family protein
MIEPTDLSAVPEVSVASVFEEFFLAHHEQLFQALYLLTGDRSEADDLAQEALRGTKTPVHHAATAWYSWIRLPTRSRRSILGTLSTGSTS